jgi:small subunit ribosomal protein S9
MMADEENAETPEQHAVPSEDAQEIAGSAEDAALEAAQEAGAAGGSSPEPPVAEPGGEGHAAPTEEAIEIAGVAEDAALEAREEADDAEAAAAAAAGASQGEDAEAAATPAATASEGEAGEQAAGDQAPGGEATGEGAAPGAKPAVPGAHLEVDIVPEGADPLGRGESYEDPYAIEEEAEQGGESAGEEQEETLSEPISTAAIDLASGARYRATGKRKTAIARVTLRPGTGTYLVNGRPLEVHFPRNTLQRNIRQPLETVGYQERMDVVARLHGGGISAQAGALRHGVSRALLEADPNLRGELKRRGFLTRDPRVKERKKAGLKKARKRPQFSKR